MARRCGSLLISVGRSRGRHGSRRALRTRTVSGCSSWKSVAEVGKKHLPSRVRGKPRGELKLRPGSTYRRRSPDTKRHPGTGERVRACRAILKRERESAHLIAKSRITPTEGVLGSSVRLALNGAAGLDPWRDGQAA